MFAAGNGHLEIATLLLQHGANLGEKDSVRVSLFDKHTIFLHSCFVCTYYLLLSFSLRVHQEYKTALMYAAENEHIDTAAMLLQKGGRLSDKDEVRSFLL